MERKDRKRFWSKVNKNGPTQPHMKTPCWLWTAGTWWTGYGRFSVVGKSVPAHRVSFGLKKIPSGMCVLHRCDNRLCVRRGHLFLGTQADNNADAKKKGRHPHGRKHGDTMRGEKSCRAVLNNKAVQKIKRRYARGGVTQEQLAEEHGVHHSTVSRAISGQRWSHMRSI